MPANNILVTGPPRSGKSTLIEKVIQGINRPATGFFTRELRERGRRVGFSITTLAGKNGVLAHQDIKSSFRVGKYGVSLADIDQIAVPSMLPSTPDQIVVVDEIGKMECFSRPFKETLLKVLSSDNLVIGSVAIKGDRFIQSIKKRDDVSLVSISQNTRDSALKLFLQAIQG
ncbi:MAG: nucleoside-triphosphatase [Syntrophobacteria bacterium]